MTVVMRRLIVVVKDGPRRGRLPAATMPCATLRTPTDAAGLAGQGSRGRGAAETEMRARLEDPVGRRDARRRRRAAIRRRRQGPPGAMDALRDHPAHALRAACRPRRAGQPRSRPSPALPRRRQAGCGSRALLTQVTHTAETRHG
jgi:hypothetical protein